MGFHNSPSIFQEYVSNLLKQIRDFVVIYIDDILIFTDNNEEHEKHLEKFIDLIEEKGLNISPKKVELRMKRIGFLGHYISEDGIELQEHISKKIEDFTEIENKMYKFYNMLTAKILNYAFMVKILEILE